MPTDNTLPNLRPPTQLEENGQVFAYDDTISNENNPIGPALNSVGQYLFGPIGQMLAAHGISPGPVEVVNAALAIINYALLEPVVGDMPPEFLEQFQKDRRTILKRIKASVDEAHDHFNIKTLILPH